ncbi:protein kinase protein, partial [Trichomonas vaginalis G3]
MSEVSYHIRIPSSVGRYKILRQIGKGGFAVVVQAVDTKTNQFVAIKIVSRQEIQRQNNMIYLENELRLCSRFDHPSIVKVFDIIYEEDIIMIVMEYFQNGDLQSLISHGIRLSFEECIRISYQILEGLTYLHKRGISHRDIKPENILFDDAYNPKLVDFGLAKENSDALSTYCGTAWYIAPEIV